MNFFPLFKLISIKRRLVSIFFTAFLLFLKLLHDKHERHGGGRSTRMLYCIMSTFTFWYFMLVLLKLQYFYSSTHLNEWLWLLLLLKCIQSECFPRVVLNTYTGRNASIKTCLSTNSNFCLSILTPACLRCSVGDHLMDKCLHSSTYFRYCDVIGLHITPPPPRVCRSRRLQCYPSCLDCLSSGLP